MDSVRLFPNQLLPLKLHSKVLIPTGLINLKGRTGIKNRGARYCQVFPDSLESSGLIKYSLPKTDIPTAGRLYHFRQAWQKITTDQRTKSVISGFRIQFRVRPKLARVVPQFLRKPTAYPEKVRQNPCWKSVVTGNAFLCIPG